MPLKAKKTPDQNTALSSDQCGAMLARVNWVAAPKRHQDTPAISISVLSGTMLPSEPMLLSHFPTLTPRILSSVMTVSQNAEKAM